MQVLILVAGFLLLACVLSSREGMTWKEEAEIDYPGNDIMGSRGSGHGTLQEARDRCESNPDCLGFNHENKPVGNFWLKHALANRGGLPGYTFYSKIMSLLGFKNVFSGGNKCLDIINDGANNKPIMAPCGDYKGQQWTMTPTKLGYVTFTNRLSGTNKCLDVLGNSLLMANCNANSMRQSWKTAPDPYNKNLNKVSNAETKMCVDIVNDGQNNKLVMGVCGNYSGQQWTTIQT